MAKFKYDTEDASQFSRYKPAHRKPGKAGRPKGKKTLEFEAKQEALKKKMEECEDIPESVVETLGAAFFQDAIKAIDSISKRRGRPEKVFTENEWRIIKGLMATGHTKTEIMSLMCVAQDTFDKEIESYFGEGHTFTTVNSVYSTISKSSLKKVLYDEAIAKRNWKAIELLSKVHLKWAMREDEQPEEESAQNAAKSLAEALVNAKKDPNSAYYKEDAEFDKLLEDVLDEELSDDESEQIEEQE